MKRRAVTMASATSTKASLIKSLFILLVLSSQCIDALRILAIFPLHGKSHFTMCEKLAKGLAARGHQVDVYSHFPLKKPVPNYTDYSLAGTLPAVVNNMTYEYIQQFDRPNIQVMLNEVGNKICELMDTPVFQQLFEKLKKEQPYDVVIVEVFVSNCYMAWGEFLKVPLVGVMTSALIDWYHEPLGNPHNTAVDPSIWSPMHHPMDFWERLMNTLMLKFMALQTNYHMSVQDKYVEKYFGTGYPTSADLPKDLDLLLVNTHHSIDGVKAYTPAIIPVAGLHIGDDGIDLPLEVQKWLDDSRDGCIYMSFGSMVRIETFPPKVLAAIYETFKRIAPVRVLMKIAKPQELPPGLPSNVITQSWFSQVKVLKHKNLKAFVTHGGLMSTQESLAAGIPLIGFPLFGDQHINIKAQARRKVAVALDVKNIDSDKFYSAIMEVLKNPVFKKNAEKFAIDFFDRPMGPMDTAGFWVEYVARHGKQALRSPIVDMPWYQANLIDVYGFMLGVLITACYVIKLVVKKVLGLCCSSSSNKKKRE